ncbi:hypothetical protein ACFO4E_01300 [Nocardiopsis mangrovi]|uniref:TetR family transcriptional regulator n=1 Tax=Nocardiopsis mangrovi TaxID=1179818 RepID=A0ABV9DQY3_9ACTN
MQTDDAARPYQVVPADAVVADAVDAGRRPPAAVVRSLASGGRPVLVRCSAAAGTAGGPGAGGAAPRDDAAEIALVALYAWMGATVFATSQPREARRALDMVASIRGDRPPAVARRGLA